MNWWEHANCRRVDTDLFFPDRGCNQHHQQTREALALCETCTVKDECLADAIHHGDAYGIRGGLTENQRKWLRYTQPWTQKRWCVECRNPFTATNRARTLCSQTCKTVRAKRNQELRTP